MWAQRRWASPLPATAIAVSLLACKAWVRPAAALLADLGRITPVHLPLLAVARQLSVPVVAFGSISADLSADDLANVHLTARDRLAEALADLLRLKPPSPPPAVRPAEPTRAPEPREPTPPIKPQEPTPAVKQPEPTSSDSAAGGEALSQEEIDALLG